MNSLKIGSVLKAQVIDIMPESVLICLPDKSIINADKNTVINASLGEYIDLSVKHKDDEKIILQYAKAENFLKAESEHIKHTLISIKVLPDEKNIQIAKQMVKNGIPLIKDVFMSIVKNVHLLNENTAEKNIFMMANNIPVNQENLEILNNVLMHRHQISSQLTQLLKQAENGDEAVQKILSNLKDLIDGFFVKIDKSNIDRFIRDLKVAVENDEISKAIKILKEKAQNIPDVKDLLHKLEESNDFIKRLNYVTYYTQIPININDHRTTLELYVFKNSSNGKYKDNIFSYLLLTLTTANMGYVEAFLKLKNKNLECDFRSEQKSTLDLIKKNISPLLTALKEEGYNLNHIGFIRIKEKTNILNVRQMAFNDSQISVLIDERI